jgi:ATP-binding cassette subfamily B protein
MLTWPFASIGWVTTLVQRAAASQTRINEFLKVEPEIVNKSERPFSFEGEIEFREVTYTYPNSGITAVCDLNFKLSGGDRLGIIGRTGSGKSTILKLLTRQIDPDSGVILINGVDIKEINLNQFRDQIGIIPQDVFLFSDTIENNVKFGSNNPNITMEDVKKATRLAHIDQNIEEFKNGYATLLGERGVNLSGGQKQRLSIARALIRNPKLLIMDDCLSAVDTETEEVILSNLNKYSSTSLVVSHRVSTIRNATKIITLEEGTMIESGTHEELLKSEGEYAGLYNKQLSEEGNHS